MITVVIVAYNRDKSLSRLFNSLQRAEKPKSGEDVNLIISLEGGSTQEVKKIAMELQWGYGSKKIVEHEEKKGLVNHFIWAGDQSLEYGEVLFLEDDSIVSPYIFQYLEEMIPFYRDEPYVAGISLYNDTNNEMTCRIFDQVEDGADVYFFQHPYMGNIWYGEKWKLFKEWLKSYVPKDDMIPKKIAAWDRSFKRIYIQFLVENGLYIVYPRCSLVSDCADQGLHVGTRKDTKARMLCGYQPMKLVEFSNSSAIYDAYYELEPRCIKMINKELKDYEFTNDINCLKTVGKGEIVLTNRKVKKYIYAFDCGYKPIEVGAVLGLEGDGLYLTYEGDIVETQEAYFKRCQGDDIARYYPVRKRTVLMLLKNMIIGMINKMS